MAKESMKARERKRERMTARYASKRAELTKVLKSSDNSEDLRGIITNKIRKIAKVQSTLTMMVIEEQESL